MKKDVSGPNPDLYRWTVNGRFVNEMRLRGRCPVDFKDLQTTPEPGEPWFIQVLLVVVRTANSASKADGGRKSDLKRFSL